MKLNDPRHTATHEAGHAVIGRVLTLVCGKATIKADRDSAGHSITAGADTCEYEWEKRGKVRLPDAVWHARTITFMAGAEAEIELLGSTQGGDSDDRHHCDMMAEELDHNERWHEIEPRLRAMTRMLVRRHRARIERVAKELIAKKTLSKRELDRIVGRSVADVKVNAPFILEMHRLRKAGR